MRSDPCAGQVANASLHADAPRSLTCMAMEEGALLVQIPQRLFLAFIASKPRTLQIYLQKVPTALSCPVADTQSCQLDSVGYVLNSRYLSDK